MLHYLRMAGLIRCAVNSYLDVSNAGIECLKEHSWTPCQGDTLRASGLSKQWHGTILLETMYAHWGGYAIHVKRAKYAR